MFDQQTVQIEFADGTLAAHCLFSNSGRGCRDIHIVGTEGDLWGDAEDGRLRLARPDIGANRNEFTAEWIETCGRGSNQDTGHGGGASRLIGDFIAAVRSENQDGSATRIEDSLAGHLIGCAAAESIRTGGPVEVRA